MADMKENNMNDGVPSLDETAAEAVRLSVGPRPGAGPEKPRKDRRRIIIGAAAVAVAVLVAGGVCAHRAYESHQASVARDACESAVADQAKAVKAYKTLLGSDATVAALKTDAKTVDTLKRAAAVRLPAMVKCDASKAADLDAAAAKAARTSRTVKADAKLLKTAVKAVETSKLDKTVADANALYKATDGKVADDKTRQDLDKAVKARDAEAIAKAVKAVNDSKTAKEKADAEARAKAEQEAAAQAAAAQQAQQSQQRSYPSSGSGSNRSYSSGGWSAGSGGSGSTGGQSYSGSSSSGSSTPSNGSDDYDITQDPFFNQHTTNSSCASGGFCPIG